LNKIRSKREALNWNCNRKRELKGQRWSTQHIWEKRILLFPLTIIAKNKTVSIYKFFYKVNIFAD